MTPIGRDGGISQGFPSEPHSRAHTRPAAFGQACVADDAVFFDPARGEVDVASGVSLRTVFAHVSRFGFRLPVMPGTGLVTVGGAIAADVHGKNHHRRGSFGHHVTKILLLRSDGSMTWCSPTDQQDLFRATVGGLGLTGLILRAKLQALADGLGWIESTNTPFGSLTEYFDHVRGGEAEEHVSAWVDCSTRQPGRGVIEKARHTAAAVEANPPLIRHVPSTPPAALVDRSSSSIFDALHLATEHSIALPSMLPTDQFLQPLDAAQDWLRRPPLTAPYQYQCVIPRPVERSAVPELLREVSRHVHGVGLAVLKPFGDSAPAGIMSFTRAGTSLSLDLPSGRLTADRLASRLNAIVIQAGGAVYGAKDARLFGPLFRLGYPRWREAWAQRDPGVGSTILSQLFESVDR